GGARTHDRRIMRSAASCTTHASCTDDTDHRTGGSHHAGTIWRAGPRTGPRSRPPRPLILLLCVTSLRAPGVRQRGRSRSRALLRCLDFPRYLPGLVVIALECWLSSTSSWEVTVVGIMPSGGAGPRC